MKNYDALYKCNIKNIQSLLEIGVASGGTTKLILEDNKIKLNKFAGIDPHIPYIEKTKKENMDNAKNKYLKIIENSIVKYYNDFSINVLSKFVLNNNFFDCIIIDGCHMARNVLEDLILSFNILNINGYLIIDDYKWFPNRKNTREIFFESFELTPIYRRCKDVIDIFIKAYEPNIKIIFKGDIVILQKINKL